MTDTLGGSGTTVTGGGGPGGTSSGAGGGGAGAGGLVLSTNGGGPAPENLDPIADGDDAVRGVESAAVEPAVQRRQISLNHGYGDIQLRLSAGISYWHATWSHVQQHARDDEQSVHGLQPGHYDDASAPRRRSICCRGLGWGINGRFIVQAKNDRQDYGLVVPAAMLYTVNQVENIYWGLVSAYEDEQAKERALAQSTQLTADNRKQLEIGTLAPLDVVNSDRRVATDKQALVASKSNLEYQQLIMKQAIARNLEDPELANAPVIPTDRVALDRLPEEDMSQDDW